jgi:IQ calmodulin-binding motif
LLKVPLISKKLTKLLSDEEKSAIFIQKIFRGKLARNKFKLIFTHSFRQKNFLLIGKGGKIINDTPYFVSIHKTEASFFIKAKNLSTEKMFYIEILPSDYIFGFIKTNSYKLIVQALTEYKKTPAFCYKSKTPSSVDISSDNFIVFKKFLEKASLHSVVKKLQSLFRSKKFLKEYKIVSYRNIKHYKKVMNGIEYRVALHLNKDFILIQVYLISKPPEGSWIYIQKFFHNQLIEKYGDISPQLLLNDLNLKDNEIVLGQKISKEKYQIQRHISYAISEILLSDKKLIRTVITFTIRVPLQSRAFWKKIIKSP